MVTSDFKPEVEIWPFCACAVQLKYAILYPYLWRNVRILASYRKSGSRNMMVTSDFRPDVEIWPFRACAIKIRYKTLIYGGIAEIPPSYRKSGSRNTMIQYLISFNHIPFNPSIMHRRQFAKCSAHVSYAYFIFEKYVHIFTYFILSNTYPRTLALQMSKNQIAKLIKQQILM